MTKFRTSRSTPLIQPYHFYNDSKVSPQFAFDCDINNIVRGMTAPLPMREPVSDDLSNPKVFSPDMYEKALYMKAEAETAFYNLPSYVREFFKNDPKAMLEFVQNPENNAKCIELGLKVANDDYQFKSDLINAIKSGKNQEKTVETVISDKKSGEV